MQILSLNIFNKININKFNSDYPSINSNDTLSQNIENININQFSQIEIMYIWTHKKGFDQTRFNQMIFEHIKHYDKTSNLSLQRVYDVLNNKCLILELRDPVEVTNFVF